MTTGELDLPSVREHKEQLRRIEEAGLSFINRAGSRTLSPAPLELERRLSPRSQRYSPPSGNRNGRAQVGSPPWDRRSRNNKAQSQKREREADPLSVPTGCQLPASRRREPPRSPT